MFLLCCFFSLSYCRHIIYCIFTFLVAFLIYGELDIWLHCNQARRALRALRGLVRLKSLIEGNAVKRQASTTLRCMQTLARVQSQIRSRRIRMSEENQALQRQLLQKREKELENLRASVCPLFSLSSLSLACAFYDSTA